MVETSKIDYCINTWRFDMKAVGRPMFFQTQKMQVRDYNPIMRIKAFLEMAYFQALIRP